MSLLPSVCNPVFPLLGFLKSMPHSALPSQHSPTPSLELVQGCSHDPNLSNQRQTRIPVCTTGKEQPPCPTPSATHKAAVSKSMTAMQGGPAERPLTPKDALLRQRKPGPAAPEDLAPGFPVEMNPFPSAFHFLSYFELSVYH